MESPSTKKSQEGAAQRGSDKTGLARVVRPTLIVALGGTGTASAKVAKARITQMTGMDCPFVAFRAFDTDIQDDSAPRLIDNAEFIYLGGFNAQAVVDGIAAGQAYTHWGKWMPPRLNFQQVAFGAGGIRPIGRLCYFYRREQIQAAIGDALSTITDGDKMLALHKQEGTRVSLEGGIDIHVIFSICGGTGSGMFLDLAFDLRRWTEGYTDKEVTLTGHVVLPEAFGSKPVVMRALEANTYASLQELDHYMNGSRDDPWRVEYTAGNVLECNRAPFDHCYLLSGLQHGATMDIDALTAAIGETIALTTVTQIGHEVVKGITNMAGQRKATRDVHGRTCCYSSYGVLVMEIPYELLGRSLGMDLARDTHRKLLAPPPDKDEQLELALSQFADALQLHESEVVSHLIPDANPDLGPSGFCWDDNENTRARAETQLALKNARMIWRQSVEQNRKSPMWDVDTLRKHIGPVLQAIMREASGLVRSVNYLERAAQILLRFQGSLQIVIDRSEQDAELLKERAESIEGADITGLSREGVDNGVRHWQHHLRAIAVHTILRQQALKLNPLVRAVNSRAEQFRRLTILFEHLRLVEPIDEATYYRLHRARTSICPLSHFLKLLEPHRGDIVQQVLDRLVEKTESWAEMEANQLSLLFYDLCTEAIQFHFKQEAEMDCDRLLAECYSRPSSQYTEILSVMRNRARAAWEIHETYGMRENILEIACMGATVDSPMFQTLNESNHRLSSIDEQRAEYVPLLCTEHGLSLSGLKRLPDYRKSLIDVVLQEQRFDFHFFNDFRWVTKLEFPDEDSEAGSDLRTFSLAEMLGIIERRSDGQYFVAMNGLPSQSLGAVRRLAYEKFCRDEGTLAKVARKVEEEVFNSSGAIEKVEEWIDSLEKRVDQAVRARRNPLTEVYLSRDIFQVHAEIRAIRAAMRSTRGGI